MVWGSGFAATPPHGSLVRWRLPRVRRFGLSRLRPRRFVACERIGQLWGFVPPRHGGQSKVHSHVPSAISNARSDGRRCAQALGLHCRILLIRLKNRINRIL